MSCMSRTTLFILLSVGVVGASILGLSSLGLLGDVAGVGQSLPLAAQEVEATPTLGLDAPLPIMTGTTTPEVPPTSLPIPTAVPTTQVAPTTTGAATAGTPAPSPMSLPTLTLPAGGFLVTAGLDDFGRPNGGLGGNWSGITGSYAVLENRLDVNGNGGIIWNGASFGVEQEVFVRLAALDSNTGSVSLLLKSQSNSSADSGVIRLLYNRSAQIIQVWSLASGQGWVQRGGDIPATLVSGDQFGARVDRDGMVWVYRNGELLGSRALGNWPYAAGGGFIGLWMGGASNSFLDDFGGGTSGGGSSATRTPARTPTRTRTPRGTPTTTRTPTRTSTQTATRTPTRTAAVAGTNTPTRTRTATLAASVTRTPSATATVTRHPSGSIVVDHNSVALFEQIPESYLQAAAAMPMIFVDRSVGQNIDDGLDCLGYPSDEEALARCRVLDHVDPRFTVNREQLNWSRAGGYSRSNWDFHFWPETGCSEWFTKLECFLGIVDPVIGQYAVLSYQFSYLEVDEGSTIADQPGGFFSDTPGSRDVFDHEAYETEHPDKVFIYWTTSLARAIGTRESESFNEQMREYASRNDKPLFDVADILSHDPSGAPCYDNRDGVAYGNGNNSENHPDDGVNTLAICQHYTTETEGGHLGAVSVGSIRVAKAFWVLMAQLAGWRG